MQHKLALLVTICKPASIKIFVKPQQQSGSTKAVFQFALASISSVPLAKARPPMKYAVFPCSRAFATSSHLQPSLCDGLGQVSGIVQFVALEDGRFLCCFPNCIPVDLGGELENNPWRSILILFGCPRWCTVSVTSAVLTLCSGRTAWQICITSLQMSSYFFSATP